MADTLAPSQTSPFALAAADLVARGFHVVPIAPRTADKRNTGKAPGDRIGASWRPSSDWPRLKDRRPTALEMEVWGEWGDAGIGIILGSRVGDYQVVAVDIDVADHDVVEELCRALPYSPMAKKGRKGLTRFYRADPAMKTRQYKTGAHPNTRVLAEILSGNETRQTVVPPSIHPDTGKPYQWLNGASGARAQDLPILSAEHLAAFEEALQAHGWNAAAERERKVYAAGGAAHVDGPFAALNAAALAQLDAWVPALPLYNLDRARGGYAAVATWRSSSTGRAAADRKQNLSIQPVGIKDFGDDRAYSALDLVMAAHGWDLERAFAWLDEALNGKAESVIDLRGPASPAAPSSPAAPAPAIEDENDSAEAVDPADLLADMDEAGASAPIYPPHGGDADMPRWSDPPPSMLVRMLQDWIVAGAAKPMPTLALAAALTTVGTLIGRQYRTPLGGSTALYVLCLAPSGGGKNRPIGAPGVALEACGLGSLIGPQKWTAGSTLEKELKDRPLFLCKTDEYSDTLARMTAWNAPPAEQGKMQILKELFSANFDVYKTQSMAAARAIDIHAPHVSIVAAATPGKFFATLTAESIESGFFNRWLTFAEEATVDAERQAAIDAAMLDRMTSGDEGEVVEQPPETLVHAMRYVHVRRDAQVTRGGGMTPPSVAATGSAFKPMPAKVMAEPAAAAAYQAYFKWTTEVVPAAHPEDSVFYQRSAEIALRMATILALGDRCLPGMDTDAPVAISLAQMVWAVRLSDWCTRRTVSMSQRHMNHGRHAVTLDRIMAYLGKSRGGWVERRSIANRFLKEIPPGRSLNDFLGSLVESGFVARKEEARKADGRGGRATELYRLVKRAGN